MSAGLRNLGNTCFMNSALQCIIHSPELASEMVKIQDSLDKKDCPSTFAVARLLCDANKDGVRSFSPRYIRSVVSKHFPFITDGSQHDSHEFFTLFLQILEEEQNQALGADKSQFSSSMTITHDSLQYSFLDAVSSLQILNNARAWWKVYRAHNPNCLSNVYYGAQASILTCRQCSHQSIVFSSFNTLYMSFPESQSQITVNVIIEYCSPTDVNQGILPIQSFPLYVRFGESDRLYDIASCIRHAARIHGELGSHRIVLVQGILNERIMSIDYAVVDYSLPVRSLLSSHQKSTLLAYFIPNEDPFIFMTSNAIHYLGEDSLIHFDNAHIPLLLTIPSFESLESFLMRCRTVIQTLYMKCPENMEIPKRADQSSSEFAVDSTRLQESLFFRGFLKNEGYPNHYEASILPILRRMDQTRCRFTELDAMQHISFKDCGIQGEIDASLPAAGFFEKMGRENASKTPCITNIYMLSKKTITPPAIEAYFRVLSETNVDEIHNSIKQKIDILLNMLVRKRLRRDASSSIQLTECLRNSLTSEAVEMCDHCKEKTVRDIENRVTELPPILVILLKRFSYDFNNNNSGNTMSFFGSRSKITDFVSFPIEGLDLSPYSVGCSSTVYDLICVCNHQGSADFGHYYAYCRSAHQGNHERWYEYNDEFVREISPSSVQTENAYILMYRKRGLPSSQSTDWVKLLHASTDDYDSNGCLPNFSLNNRVASSSTLSERSTKKGPSVDTSSVSSDAEIPELRGFRSQSADIVANRRSEVNSRCFTVFIVFMFLIALLSLCAIIIVIIIL